VDFCLWTSPQTQLKFLYCIYGKKKHRKSLKEEESWGPQDLKTDTAMGSFCLISVIHDAEEINNPEQPMGAEEKTLQSSKPAFSS
jgi:hypothetical protein